MATSDIPIELRTASDDELRSMKSFSSDAITRKEGRVVDLETALEPGDKSRFPGPSSTPKQHNSDLILKEIRSINERLDTHDKDITQIMQMLHRDTDEYVDPDMFGASVRPKSNPAP